MTFNSFNNIGTSAPVMVGNSGSHTDWYAGVGIGYDISERFGVGIAYDYYKAVMRSQGIDLTSTVESLTAEYRF